MKIKGFKKRAISLLVVLTMLIGMIPATAFATSEQAEAKLNSVITTLSNSFYKMQPKSGTDTNVIDVFQAWLDSKTEFSGVTAAMSSSDDTSVVGDDGTITYVQCEDTPTSNHQKNVNVKFNISYKGETKETGAVKAMIGWDKAGFEAKMHDEADRVTEDLIKSENESLSDATTDLSLPQILTDSRMKAWSTISWTSSDTNVIRIVDGDEWGLVTVPKLGKITKPAETTEVTLTAEFKPNDSVINTSLDKMESFTKEFKVTVKADEDKSSKIAEAQAEMQAKVEAGITPDIFKDFVTGEKVDISKVTGDFRWNTFSRLVKGSAYKEWSVSSSDESVIRVDGVRTYVDVFGTEDKDVDLTFTWTRNDEELGTLTASKTITFHVNMIDEVALDKEIQLMDYAKAHYFDGIKADNADAANVLTDLHSFREIRYNGDTEEFIYTQNDRQYDGIAPDDIDPADKMGTSGFNYFKSSDTAVITHENLLVTRPLNDTEVTISSVLTSERFGAFAKNHTDNEKLQKLYRQPVSTTVTVKGTSETVVEPTTITAQISAQAENAFILPYTNASITSGLAKRYGYSYGTGISPADVTALDALVAAHIQLFGDDFEENTTDYLVVGSTGLVTKMFGMDAMASSFTVNGECPHDGVINPTYNQFTGKMVNEAVINDNDDVEFMFYQDTDMYMDYKTYFTQNGRKIKSIDAAVGEDISLILKGYMLMYGSFTSNEAAMGIAPISDAQLVIVDENGNTTDIADAITDDNGALSLSFDEPGTYRVSAVGTDDLDYPIFMPELTVVVTRKVMADAKIDLTSGNYFIKAMQLYAYNAETGEKGAKDYLAGVTATGNIYDLTLPVGTYIAEAQHVVDPGPNVDEDPTITPIGSLVIEVKENDPNEFKFLACYGLKASNSGWVNGTDYNLDVAVMDNARNKRVVTTGSYAGCSVIVLYGDTVELTATPSEAHPTYMKAVSSITLTSNTITGISCPEAVDVTFTVPAESKLSVGKLASYYVYTFYDVEEATTLEDGKLQYKVRVPKNTDAFYRVQNPNGVTYWNYARWSAATNLEVTAEQLHIGDENFKPSTVVDDFSLNQYDLASIYLNINSAGCLNLNAGDTFELNSFRNWFAIEGISNAKVALPDMHYEVIDANGNPTDIISVVPDEKNSNVAKLKANKEGMAIVLVTYDAMTHELGMGGKKQFSAIWPECTGVIAVNVGGTEFNTNMTINRLEAEASPIDSEHDILFYTGDEGASYTFTPEAGASVSVARSSVGSKMTFTGFTSQGVTKSEDGQVTITGLKAGRHIVKVEKDGKATYQVISTRQTSYEITKVNGEAYTEGMDIKAGDKVGIQFHKLINPKEKISGAYNFHATLFYKGEDGSKNESKAKGPFGVYDFSSDEANQQYIEITIPKYWAGSSYTLEGNIHMGGFAGVPSHRGITYAKGTNPGFNAPNVQMFLSSLPKLTIDLAGTEFLSCKMNFQDEEGRAIDRKDINIDLKDAAGNGIVIGEDGSFKAVAESFGYTINAAGYRYKAGSVDINAETKEYTITLQSAGVDTWDGISFEEPEKDEAGVYQVAKGSQLAWLAKQVNDKKFNEFSAKLIADIDLGDYPWEAINKNGYSYSYNFDGNNHEITGLYTTKGLFNTVGGTTDIKNLTVRGNITTTGGSAGAVVGYLQKGLVENCVSYVTINGTGANNTMFGGIAGYVGNGATIKNCINKGTITVEGKQAAGIVGGSVNANASIENCYNEANITAGSQAGGVLGGMGTYAMTVKNCYSIGTVTGGNAFAGSAESVKAENCYALVTDPIAETLSSDDMKCAQLGDGFVNACGRYPALVFENAKAHVPAENPVAVAPTCTTKGYTIYTCTDCHDTYKADYVDALGHDWCDTEDDTDCDDCIYVAPTCTEAGSITHICRREGCTEEKVDIIPATGHTSDPEQEVVFAAYKECVCSVCGEHYIQWNDGRLAKMTLPKTMANITMADNGSYPWKYDEADRLVSGNYNLDKTTSETSITITVEGESTLSFDYGVSSEARYDKLTITLTDGDTTEKIADAISGNEEKSFEKTLAAGTYTLKLSYTKDSSSKSGEDLGYIKNVKLVVTELLTNAKTTANEHIDAVDKAAYREAEVAIIEAKAEAAKSAIEEATTPDEVDALVAEFDDEIAALKTNDKYVAEAFEAEVASKLSEEITLDSKALLDEIVTAKEALTEAQLALVDQEVLDKLDNALNAYQLMKDAKDLQDAKDTANAELDKTDLTVYRAAEKSAAEALILDGKANINAAESIEAVANVLKNTKDEIAKIKTDAELTLEENIAAAANAEKLINEIGEVSLNSKAAIDAARTAYDALTADQKEYIKAVTVDTLVNAEKEYAKEKAAEEERIAAEEAAKKEAEEAAKREEANKEQTGVLPGVFENPDAESNTTVGDNNSVEGNTNPDTGVLGAEYNAAPKTGDMTNVAMMTLVLIVAAGLAGSALYFKRKRD